MSSKIQQYDKLTEKSTRLQDISRRLRHNSYAIKYLIVEDTRAQVRNTDIIPLEDLTTQQQNEILETITGHVDIELVQNNENIRRLKESLTNGVEEEASF